MKVALWILVVVLGALWTGGAFLTAFVAQALGALVAAGGATGLGQAAAQVPVPAWLALWGIDPAWVRGLQEALLWALQAMGDLLPWIGSALGYLVPLVWVLWAIGLIVLFLLAGSAHFFLGRRGRVVAAS